MRQQHARIPTCEPETTLEISKFPQPFRFDGSDQLCGPKPPQKHLEFSFRFDPISLLMMLDLQF